jgi:MFS family permease
MQIVAMSWMAYQLADSPFLLGLIQFISVLPVGLVSLVGGVVSDRFSPWKLVLGTQVILIVQVLILAGLTWAGSVRLWHIMVMIFVVGATDAIEQPARYVLMFRLVGQQGLSNAVGLSTLADRVARFAAPAIAGVLIRWRGEGGSFLPSGAAYLLAVLLFSVVRLPEPGLARKPVHFRADLLDGIRHLWHNATTLGLILLLTASCFLAQPYTVLLPVLARDVLQTDARGYGLLMSAVGAGATCGALVAASIKRGHRGRWLVGTGLAFPALLALSTPLRQLPFLAGLLVLAAASQLAQLVLISSLLMLDARSELHGRVASLLALIGNGLTRLGGVSTGLAASFWGAPTAIAGGALLSIFWTLAVVWSVPALRRLE